VTGILARSGSNSLYQIEGIDCTGASFLYWPLYEAQFSACDADGWVSACGATRRSCGSHRKRGPAERSARRDFSAAEGTEPGSTAGAAPTRQSGSSLIPTPSPAERLVARSLEARPLQHGGGGGASSSLSCRATPVSTPGAGFDGRSPCGFSFAGARSSSAAGEGPGSAGFRTTRG
jgi:hypothetical protein